MHFTVYVLSYLVQLKVLFFSIAANFKYVQSVSKTEDLDVSGIQVYEKCQGLFILNDTREAKRTLP